MKIKIYKSADELSYVVKVEDKIYGFHCYNSQSDLDFAFNIAKQFVSGEDNYLSCDYFDLGRLILSLNYNFEGCPELQKALNKGGDI